jgi:hypothetical protein
MSYECEQRIKRLANFNKVGNKTSQIEFKSHGMRFFAYIQDAENDALELICGGALDKGLGTFQDAILNDTHDKNFLSSYLD